MPNCSATPDPQRCRFQFSLRGLLIAQTAFVLLVGVAYLLEVIDAVVLLPVTVPWHSSARRGLINMGVPVSFVTGYVSFAFIRLGEWAVLALVNLILGLLRSKRAHVGAWLLAIAFPFKDLVLSPQMAFYFNVRVVSLFGSLIGLAAWFIGWRLRGRDYERAVELRPKWLRSGLQIAVWILLAIAGSWGWVMLVEVKAELQPFIEQMLNYTAPGQVP